jgi:hypothetical protein
LILASEASRKSNPTTNQVVVGPQKKPRINPCEQANPSLDFIGIGGGTFLRPKLRLRKANRSSNGDDGTLTFCEMLGNVLLLRASAYVRIANARLAVLICSTKLSYDFGGASLFFGRSEAFCKETTVTVATADHSWNFSWTVAALGTLANPQMCQTIWHLLNPSEFLDASNKFPPFELE